MIDVDDLIGKIVHADCMDILRELPDKCVDLVLTDPPYGDGNGGKVDRFGGLFGKYIKKKRIDWDCSPKEYVFREIFRVSKNQIIWGGNYFNLPPTRCFNVWRKSSISDSFSMASVEYAWTSFQKNAKIYDCIPNEKSRFHPTQKPLPLIMWQIEKYSSPGDIILDPLFRQRNNRHSRAPARTPIHLHRKRCRLSRL